MACMRYQVREKIFSIGDDFWVTDSQGNEVFLVDGKALRLRETFELKDAVIATVRKALISPLHHRSVVELPGGGELDAVGNILDKEFEIRSGGTVVAQISRSWFRIRDTYGVDVAAGQDDALILSIAVCLDRIHHEGQERR